MGRLFLAAVVTIVIPTLVWGDGADSRPGAPSSKTPAAKTPGEMPPIAAELKSDKQKGSFAVGYGVGTQLRQNIGSGSLDLAAFLLGVQQSISGQQPVLSQREREKSFKILLADIRRQKMKEAAEASETNRKKGDEFLAANKQQKGVNTLPSGLQYVILKEGKGKQPKATDEVEVHYHGTLIDGTVFDSSVNRGEPAKFTVDGVIPGWTEALQLMKEGAKWRVFVPAKLAYGPKGRPGIGPNQTLIFDIELLKVK